jgi:hypothetical protein
MPTQATHVQITEAQPVSVTHVQLTIHEEDAAVLRFVLGRVLGPAEGARGAADRINAALDAAGIKVLVNNGSNNLSGSQQQGQINFNSAPVVIEAPPAP